MKNNRRSILLLIALFFLSIFGFEKIKWWMYEFFNKTYLIEGSGRTYNLPLLAWQHFEMSFLGCVCSIILGVILGLIAVSRWGGDFKPVIEKLTSLTRALPAIGILAIFIPIFGFGVLPGAVVLIIGGTMPIVFSTIAGLENVPADMIEAGVGLGMSDADVFFKVKVPSSLPVLISGMRTASIIIIGSATLTAISGAGGLGIPIFNSGIRGFDPIMLLEGALPVTIMALLADQLFAALEDYAKYRYGVVA